MHKLGFTLLELLIVVTIVAIIVGFALPHFHTQKNELSNKRAAPASPRTLAQACLMGGVEDVTHDGCDYILITFLDGKVMLVHKGNCRACIARTMSLPAEKQGE